MSLPHLNQPLPAPPQQQQQLEESRNSRDFYTTFNCHVSPPPQLQYLNNSSQQQSHHQQHPPYVPPFNVVGLAPGSGAVGDASDLGMDLLWNYAAEPKRKRLEEMDFLENNSQLSIDFIQVRPVSTGLGLSLDNNNCYPRVSSSSCVDSQLSSLIGDDIDRELRRQDLEIDRFLKAEADRLRQNILDKVQAGQLRTLSVMEDKVLQKLREKEAEVESINKKNMELEERMEQLSMEVGAWQQRAKYNENMITALKYNLQQVYAQSRDSKEGCGDSEVDDTASCCDGRVFDFHTLCKGNNTKQLMTCKVCGVNAVRMLLLPCKHLCLCKECESKLSFCPLCQTSKFVGMEIYM